MKQNPALPLSGVTVLDLSRVLAGPWATQMLGDLGAQILKIEKPGDGDDTRRWGPPFVIRDDGAAGDAAYFLAANRNKFSLAIDFSKPEGAEIVRALAAKADILVENFKTGGLAKYGLDYESIAAINARLVYCSITGFGQTGPEAGRAGYDFMIQGLGGLMSITGAPDSAPGGGPVKTGVAIADLFAGMYANSATLAALRHAERTGEGQHVDVSLLDCQLAMLTNQAANYFVKGEAPGRLGNAHPNIAPYQTFETKDRPIIIAVGNDRQFTAFCRVIGAEALSDDPHYSTNPARVQNRASLTEKLAAKLRNEDAQYWLAALEQAGVPAGPINTIAEAFEEPQAAARKMRITLPREGEAPSDYVPYPVKFSRTPPGTGAAPPKLGADTEAKLHEILRIDDTALSELRKKGVINEA